MVLPGSGAAKGIAESSWRTASRVCGDANRAAARREKSQPTAARKSTPSRSCIAPWQQGRRFRDGRGVGREPPATGAESSGRSASANCAALRLPGFRKGGGSESPHAVLRTVEGPERRLASPGSKFQTAFSRLWLEELTSAVFRSFPQRPALRWPPMAQYHRNSVPEFFGCGWF